MDRKRSGYIHPDVPSVVDVDSGVPETVFQDLETWRSVTKV